MGDRQLDCDTSSEWKPELKYDFDPITSDDEIVTVDLGGTPIQCLKIGDAFQHIVKMVRMIPDYRKHIPSIRNMEMDDDDVLICAFSKSDIDFRIGLPKNMSYRGARFEPYGINAFLRSALKTPSMWMFVIGLLLNPDNLLSKASAAVTDQITTDPYMREIAISSVSGHGTARGMAKLYGILANGGKLGDKQFLSEETLKALTTPKVAGESLNYGRKIQMGRGLYYSKNPKNEDVYGHPGYGGQMAYGDTMNNIGMAYLTNDLSAFGYGNDPKFLALQKEFYNCLNNIEKSKSSLGKQFDTLSVS
ncbi:unnamed protein product [Mytilus coruscus]|uniref:Beta-lactamase-related domain-containing protein n=1 Tax=Mytilus coruscus TaxID=42192 RepID=A0A6J8CKC6_MYTCO|nr:unnamed protein product [Mytilus coruscus]